MKKQPQITDATRQRIKDALWTLYQEHPAGRITVQMVSEEARVHRSTFYRYFSDVYSILEQIQDEELQKLEQDIERIIQKQFEENYHLDSTLLMLVMQPHVSRACLLLHDDPGHRFRSGLERVMSPLIQTMLRDDLSDAEKDYVEKLISMVLLMNIELWNENNNSEQVKTMIGTSQKIFHEGIINYLK